MRWSYKTVHYDLKKEGFLGSTFLDETEVEQSLNEYGDEGWELVSMMETQDGLIAVFKRPSDNVEAPITVGEVIEDEFEYEDEVYDNETYGEEAYEDLKEYEELNDYDEGLITEEDIIEDHDEEQEPDFNDDLKSIRIE